MKPYALAFTVFRLISVLLILVAMGTLLGYILGSGAYLSSGPEFDQMRSFARRAIFQTAFIYAGSGFILYFLSSLLARVTTMGYREN